MLRHRVQFLELLLWNLKTFFVLSIGGRNMYFKYNKWKQIRNVLNLTSEIGVKRFGFSKTFAQNVRYFGSIYNCLVVWLIWGVWGQNLIFHWNGSLGRVSLVAIMFICLCVCCMYTRAWQAWKAQGHMTWKFWCNAILHYFFHQHVHLWAFTILSPSQFPQLPQILITNNNTPIPMSCIYLFLTVSSVFISLLTFSVKAFESSPHISLP